jgi:hypothetical protein
VHLLSLLQPPPEGGVGLPLHPDGQNALFAQHAVLVFDDLHAGTIGVSQVPHTRETPSFYTHNWLQHLFLQSWSESNGFIPSL